MIVEFGGKYLMWSTVINAPVTCLMTREELEIHVMEEYGRNGLADLPRRMERVGKTGTSSLNGMTKADLMRLNLAGDNEAHVGTEAEMVERYTAPKDWETMEQECLAMPSGTKQIGWNKMTNQFKRGEIVRILPEFQDEGDDEFVVMTLDDESKGRVTIVFFHPSEPSVCVKTEVIAVTRIVHDGLDPINFMSENQ